MAQDFPVVAIGASAGGLEACQKLFSGLPTDSGMAFILIQHLDPNHDSMLVDLLSHRTAMALVQAEDGMRLQRDHVYVIGPGTYLAVVDGALAVSKPKAIHARLPFDVLLKSLAEDLGPRTICVILSGSGDDGALGLRAVKAAGGAVIAQDPDEAAFDGMPRSAILTGAVDQVLPVGKISRAIVAIGSRLARTNDPAAHLASGVLAQIIDLVRDRTPHDFTLYKPGTLQRRIHRRMALAAIPLDRMDLYRDRLRADPAELHILASDLLIHVTSFFRDPRVFDVLADTVAPELIRDRAAGEPIRVWVAGCSTGEEAYAIAMIFREELGAPGSDIKLQVFASDADPDAVAVAREGYYPASIADQVSPSRLARFFTREEHGYRISPELRGSVVFTVHNVLTDPPFSRLDLISCRNLLIYLRPEAQAKLLGIFHFALKAGGILLLGASETASHADGRFAVVSKPARLYRQVGRARPGDLNFVAGVGAFARPARRPGPAPSAGVAPNLAELSRRLVLEAHAPAAILINRARECLYTLGPTDHYLKVAAGAPSFDLLAMARPGVRAKLASAIAQAFDLNATVTVAGGPLRRVGASQGFQIEARPVQVGADTLVLVCFLEAPGRGAGPRGTSAKEDGSRILELEAELEAAKLELQAAVRSLEISTEEQTTINEEALSVNEEYQSTNEELLTSKEELQSLNEELNALNSQLQETLDRQRTTAADLQNILYSTDVATIFLDRDLRIRFFTPATRAVFNVIPTDVGRPLADLRAVAPDSELFEDAQTILTKLTPISREIEAADGAWYLRRLMPYRSQGDVVEGVVITYADVTERKQTAKSLEAATLAADSASRAKSRFLAAASHDLRQPLQTLTLIQGLLSRKVEGEAERKLIGLQEQCLAAMSGMLNTLLDINQIDAGIIQAEKFAFPIDAMLDRLRDEFAYHAQAKGLTLSVVPCSLSIVSDPALLEQMLRNLLANAVKYTTQGRILVGCRRRGGQVQIQVLDTGVGIAVADLQLIFEEYHQIENVARERSRGLGLGLSIVRRLGTLLGHEVGVRSQARRGSMFTIDVERAAVEPGSAHGAPLSGGAAEALAHPRRTGSILVVEDDPEVRELLELVLKEEGHRVTSAADGRAALELVDQGKVHPDVVLADYNLPGGMTGLEFAVGLRKRLGPECPVVVLTGDISTDTLRDIALESCVPLHKPVKPGILVDVIQGLLRGPGEGSAAARQVRESVAADSPLIFVVDDDSGVRDSIQAVLEADGLTVETYADCESFLAAYERGPEACLLIDAYLPGGMNGLDLLGRLRDAGDPLPAIMITGEADVRIAVLAMKAGAADFIEKPITGPELIESIGRVLEKSRDSHKQSASQALASSQIGKLTQRQRQILDMVLAGQPSKNIAADLRISQRTVENHRAAIMHKTGARSLPALARLALAAADSPQD